MRFLVYTAAFGFAALGTAACQQGEAANVPAGGKAAAIEASIESAGMPPASPIVRTNLGAGGHHEACPHTSTGAQGACCPEEAPASQTHLRPLSWSQPDTWREVPGNPMRLASFVAGDEDRIECYVALLPGDGGGVTVNVNRWRRQVGLAPLTNGEIAELPSIEMLGQRATLLSGSGNAQHGHGRGHGHEPSSGQDAAVLGVVCLLDTETLLVKLTGPRNLVSAERDNFEAFCSSIGRAG